MIPSYYHAPDSSEGSDRMRGPDEQTSRHVQLPVARAAGARGPPAAGDSPDDRSRSCASCRRGSTRMYSDIGRPSIPPEQLLRALLLQALYTIRSERLLMEEIDYSVLFRWFVGLSMDEPIWSPTTFSKNRDRLLQATSPARSSTRWSTRRARPACCPTSTSPSTGRCSRRGPV